MKSQFCSFAVLQSGNVFGVRYSMFPDGSGQSLFDIILRKKTPNKACPDLSGNTQRRTPKTFQPSAFSLQASAFSLTAQ
jgi:hypothetical protein